MLNRKKKQKIAQVSYYSNCSTVQLELNKLNGHGRFRPKIVPFPFRPIHFSTKTKIYIINLC